MWLPFFMHLTRREKRWSPADDADLFKIQHHSDQRFIPQQTKRIAHQQSSRVSTRKFRSELSSINGDKKRHDQNNYRVRAASMAMANDRKRA